MSVTSKMVKNSIRVNELNGMLTCLRNSPVIRTDSKKMVRCAEASDRAIEAYKCVENIVTCANSLSETKDEDSRAALYFVAMGDLKEVKVLMKKAIRKAERLMDKASRKMMKGLTTTSDNQPTA